MESRPPNVPKPSRNLAGIERQRQLKDRLKLKWDQKHPLYSNAQLGPAPTIDSAVKGYGEAQFADSVVLDQPSESVWAEPSAMSLGNPVGDKRVQFSSSIASVVGVPAIPGATSRLGENILPSLAGTQASFAGTSMVREVGGAKVDSAGRTASRLEALSGSIVAQNDPQDTQAHPVPYSHLEVTQSLAEHGLETVAESFVSGQTGFCYVENVNDDFYQFSIRSGIPPTLQQSKYMTLSEHGILRSAPGEGEITSFARLNREIALYRQLTQLPVFKNYRLWKLFLVWRKHVRGKKFELMKKALSEKFLWIDAFNRKLLMTARMIALEINTFKMFSVDHRDFSKTGVHNNAVDFVRFIDQQRKSNAMIAEKIGAIKEKIAELLSRESEVHICNATGLAPTSLPVDKFFSMKISSVNNLEEIVQAAQDNQAFLHSAALAGVGPPQNASGQPSAVESMLNSTLEGMSTVSNYIYNPSNISALGNQVYNLKYTQELLEDLPANTSTGIDAGASVISTTSKRSLSQRMPPATATAAATGDGSAIISGTCTGGEGGSLPPALESGLPNAPMPLASNEAATPHVSYAVRAAIRLVCRRIYCVFRIIDYMLRDLLYDKLRDDLAQLSSLLSTAYQYYDQQMTVAKASPTDGADDDPAIPIIEEGVSSINLFTKKDLSRNARSKLQSLFFKVTLNITEFEYAFSNQLVSLRKRDYSSAGEGSVEKKLKICAENLQAIAISIIPSLETCVEEFQAVLKDTCRMCTYTEGLLFSKRCQAILRPVAKEVSIVAMEDRVLVDSDQYSEVLGLVTQCIAHVSKSFQLIGQFTRKLQVLQTEFTQNIKSLVSLEQRKLESCSSEVILASLVHWDSKKDQYCALFALYNIGIFYVNLTPFRDNLVANVSHCIHSYHNYIPELYITEGDAFYKDVSRYIDGLTRPFHIVDDYIKVLEVYHLALKKQDEISGVFNYIAKLKELIEVRSIRMSEEVIKQNIILSNVYTKLNLQISTIAESFEAQVKVFRNEIIARLKTTMVPIHELQMFLATIDVQIQSHYSSLAPTDKSAEDKRSAAASHSPAHARLLGQDGFSRDAPSIGQVGGGGQGDLDFERILASLLRYKASIGQISTELQKLDRYQQLLNISVFECSVQLEIQKELNASILLVNNYVIITKLYSSVMATNYVDVNHVSIFKQLIQIRQELEDSEFFASLKDSMRSDGGSGRAGGHSGMDDLGRHSSTSTSPTSSSANAASAGSYLLNAEESSSAKPPNEGVLIIYERIFAIIRELEVYIPIVKILQSKALTVDQQRSINQLVQYRIFDLHESAPSSVHADTDYTVKKLVETVQITRYLLELETIYHEAVVKYNLGCKWKQIVQHVQSLELIFSTEADTAIKFQTYIMNYQTLVEDLEDAIVSLTSLESSTFGHDEEAGVPNLLHDTKEYLHFLQLFHRVQLAYNKYKLLFISPRSARHLSIYMRNYKTVDDTFRVLLKTAKSDKYLAVFVNEKNTKQNILLCIDHVQTIENGFSQILQEFCDRYPKLYLINENVFYQSFILTSMKEITMLLAPYLFPTMNITHIEYDGNDDSNITAITSSFLEKVSFNKMCSARNNIHDFFKLFESCIHDKFEKDIRDMVYTYLEEQKNLSLVDEIKNNNKYTAQALLLIYQIQFWNNFWKQLGSFRPGGAYASGGGGGASHSLPALSGYNRAIQSKLKTMILELQESIGVLYTIYTEPISSYGIQLTSNMIVTISYYRDLLKNILEEYNLCWDHDLNVRKTVCGVMSGVSLVFCNMQKYIEYYPNNVNMYNSQDPMRGSSTNIPSMNNSNMSMIVNNIYIAIGGEKIKYGLKYHGFAERLVVHPIVDKFYFSMIQALQNHSVAYVTNPATSQNCGVGSVDMLKMLSYELGTEQFFFQTKDLSLFGHNDLLYQHSSASTNSGATSSADKGSKREDFLSIASSSKSLSNILQFNRIVRAAMKSGLWVTLISEDVCVGKEMHTSLLTYISSVLSIVYSELHNRNHQHGIANYVNNVNEFNTCYKTVKYELFNNFSADHTAMNQMKFILYNSNAGNQHLFHTLFQSSHMFRPITMPVVSIKVVLSILLASYNFVHIQMLSERLEQLVAFLLQLNYGSYHLLKYLLIQSIRHIGNHSDHLLINVSMQLQLIVKRFLNNLPNLILSRIHENNHMPVLYNLFLEQVYDADKDKKDYYTNSYRQHLSYEEELVARLWDSTSPGSGSYAHYNVQLQNTAINYGVFHNDIQAITSYNKYPPMPLSESLSSSANSTTIAAITAASNPNTIYKRNVLVLGSTGVGKSELISKALASLHAKYFNPDRPNISILPYVVNPRLVREEEALPPAHQSATNSPRTSSSSQLGQGGGIGIRGDPSVLTVDKDVAFIQNYLQTFFNKDVASHLLNIVCFDVTDFYGNAHLMQQISQFVLTFYRLHRIKMIFETTNISDLDPSFITQFDVLYIEAPLFSAEELFGKYLLHCTNGESGAFRRVLEEMTEAFLKPMARYVLSLVSSSASADFTDDAAAAAQRRHSAALHLIPQFYTVISMLFYQFVFPITEHGVQPVSLAASSPTNAARLSARPVPGGSMFAAKQQSASLMAKPYKLPNVIFDEDSLRRIVIYAGIWVCAGCTDGYVAVVESQDKLEKVARAALGELAKTAVGGLKRVIPSSSCSIFDQYLCPRLQTEGAVAVSAMTSGTTVLEWTVIDAKHMAGLIYHQTRGKKISLNNFLLHSSIGVPWKHFHEIYVGNSLSVNACYLQSGLGHLLPFQLQGVDNSIQNNTLFHHHMSNFLNVVNTRGLLVHGAEEGSGKKSLLKQLVHSLQHSRYPAKQWMGYTNAVLDEQYSSLTRFILESRRKTLRKRYEQNILNYGCVFIEDLQLQDPRHDSLHSNAIRHLMQYNALFDESKVQFRVFNSFFVAATASGSSKKSRLAMWEDAVHGGDTTKLSRWFVNIQIPAGHIDRVMERYFESNVGIQFHEVCYDVANILIHFLRLLQGLISVLVLPNEAKFKLLQTANAGLSSTMEAVSIQQHSTIPSLFSTLPTSLPGVGSTTTTTTATAAAAAAQTSATAAIPTAGRALPTNAQVRVLDGILRSMTEKYPDLYSNTISMLFPLLSLSASKHCKELLNHLIQAIYAFNHQGMNAEASKSTLVNISSTDILGMMERVLCDYFNRFLHVAYLMDLINITLEHTVTHGVTEYRLNNMLGLLDKVRLMRMANYENIASNPSNRMNACEPLSYTRNIYGFFKTGNNMLPVLVTAEFLRDTLCKKITNSLSSLQAEAFDRYLVHLDHFAVAVDLFSESSRNLLALSAELARLYRNSLAFWHDILRLLSVWTGMFNSASQCSVILLKNCANLYNAIGTDYDLRELYHKAHHEQRLLVRLIVAVQYFNNARLEILYLPTEDAATSSASGAVKGIEAVDVGVDITYANFTNCLRKIVHFLCDDYVLHEVYAHIRSLRSQHRSAAGVSSSQESESLIDENVFAFLGQLLPSNEFQVWQQVEVKYSALLQSQSEEYPRRYDGLHVVDDVTIWVINMDEHMDTLSQYMADLTLQSGFVATLLRLINNSLDAELYGRMGVIIAEYNKRQKFIIADYHSTSIVEPTVAVHNSSVLHTCDGAETSRYFPPHRVVSNMEESMQSLSRVTQSTIPEALLFSEYAVTNEIVERLLHTFISLKRGVAKRGSRSEKEAEDEEAERDKAQLRNIMATIESFLSLCYSNIVVFYGYNIPTTASGASASEAARNEENVDPRWYVQEELRLLFSQFLQHTILQFMRVDFLTIRKRMMEMMNNYVAYNFQNTFFGQYLSAWQPVDMLLFIVFVTFYHCQLPSRFEQQEAGTGSTAALHAIFGFVVTHLPSLHKSEQLPMQSNGCGLKMEEIEEYSAGLSIFFENMFFAHCAPSRRDPKAQELCSTWATLYSIPSSRVCKSHLLALFYLQSSDELVIKDHTFLSSFFLSDLLRWKTVDEDNLYVQGKYLFLSVPHDSSDAAFNFHMDATMLLAHGDCLADMFVLYLLDHDMLKLLASELHSLFVQRKQFFINTILLQDGPGQAPHHTSHSATSVSNAKHSNERFTGLYIELVQRMARAMDTVMLLFTNLGAVKSPLGAGATMLSTVFSEFIRLVGVVFSIARAKQEDEFGHSYSIEELVSTAVHKLLHEVLPTLLSDEDYTNVTLNVVLDFVYLPLYKPSHQQTSFLMEQRYQLMTLMKDLYCMDYHSPHSDSDGGRKSSSHSTNTTSHASTGTNSAAVGYRLDKRFGIVSVHSDSFDDASSSKSASSAHNTPTRRSRKKHKRSTPSDGRSTGSRARSQDGSRDEGSTGSDSEDEDSEEEGASEQDGPTEAFVLSPESKSIFRQMLLLISSIFPTNLNHAMGHDDFSLPTFYYKYIHTAHNTTFNLSILDDIHEDIEIYLDFATEVYYTGILFPSSANYAMNVLDKLLVCLVCKLSAVNVICRDFIMSYGCAVDMSQPRMKRLLELPSDVNVTHDLETLISTIPLPMDGSPMRGRLSSLSGSSSHENNGGANRQMVFHDILSARELVYHVYSGQDLVAGTASAGISNFNIFVCHGIADIQLIVDYVVQGSRVSFLAATGNGIEATNSPLNRATSTLRQFSTRKMMESPNAANAGNDDAGGSGLNGRMSRSPSKLVRGNSSITGAYAGPSLQAVYAKYITTVYFDNTVCASSPDWPHQLIQYLSVLKNLFVLYGIVHVVCVTNFAKHADWLVLKQFVMKERMNLILTSGMVSAQELSMNDNPLAKLARRTLHGNTRTTLALRMGKQLSRRISSYGDDDDDDDFFGRKVAGRTVHLQSILSYPLNSLFRALHAFDAAQVSERIKQYIYYMSHVSYLLDNNTGNRFILQWPAYFSIPQQEEICRLSRLAMNRVRWLLIFFHISLVYYYEVVRFVPSSPSSSSSDHSAANFLNDTLLYHATMAIEKLWLSVLNAVLSQIAAMPPSELPQVSRESFVFSEDRMVQMVLSKCYEQFDEINLHHIILLLIYYPYLHTHHSRTSLLDELHVKFIFESIFTNQSTVYTSPYYILSKLLLPLQINLYKSADVQAFYRSLRILLTNATEEEQKERQMTYAMTAARGQDGQMVVSPPPLSLPGRQNQESSLVLDLLFISQPQISTKFALAYQSPAYFVNHHAHRLPVRRLQSTLYTSNLQSSHLVALGMGEKSGTPTTSLAPLFGGVRLRFQSHTMLFSTTLQCMCTQQILYQLMDRLPPLLDTYRDERIRKTAQLFKIGKEMEAMKGRNTMVARPQPMGGGGMGSIKSRRKAGQRMILQFQARDYDSLWVQMLLEVEMYNQQLQALKSFLFQLGSACCDVDHLRSWLSFSSRSSPSSPLSVRAMANARGHSTQEKDRERWIQDLLSLVPRGYLPDYFASCRDGILQAFPFLTQQQYLRLWQERHAMLQAFVYSGSLNHVRLHLLENVQGLLYALKESYAMKNESSIEKIYMHYDLCSVPQHHRYVQSIYPSNAAECGGLDIKENMGCNLRAVDVMLYQARLAGKGAHAHVYTSGSNSASLHIEFLPPCSQTSFGSEVVLHIFPSLVEQSVDPESFLCPLIVSSFPAVPRGWSAEDDRAAAVTSRLGPRQVTCWVPIHTMEDSGECTLSRIAMYSKPPFVAPV